ncbi:MAG: U32 family peptidase [Desulfobulbaceae bacterium]|nr:U32 family peptidase [Desulfobulbaceae bacterium]
MPPLSLSKTELLAPVGGLESFFAAMEAGADAVYCGLQEFSARAKAKNFSLAEVERMATFCHRAERRLYVALNTLVKEAELPRLVETLAGLEASGIDGIIIQDLGVWKLARDHFPGLPLHASTQMTVHNAAGVQMLERMGFVRAVLARELSLREIGAIRKQTAIELEHFIHGALCFAISGQCLFSSFLTGKSGNRGRCAQPCRRRYHHKGKPGYYFSTNDLCAIELLPQLIEAGVISFKIEGRMKSAEYVGRVVSAYRLVLDAPPAGRQEALARAAELLELSFGRPPTKGFLAGFVPTSIASPARQGSIGRHLGQIAAVRGNAIHFTTGDRLHLGDRLRVLPKNDQAGSGFTITTLMVGKRQVKAAKEGDAVIVSCPASSSFQAGDAVYRVGAERAFGLSEEACRRKLEAERPMAVPVRLAVALADDCLTIEAEAGEIRQVGRYPVESFVATESPLSAETLRQVFARTGEAGVSLEAFSAGVLPPVVIPPSRLKEVRREVYQRLVAAMGEAREQRRQQRIDQALAALLPARPAEPVAMASWSVAGRDPRDVAVLDEPEVAELILPLNPANVRAIKGVGRQLAESGPRLVWDLPAIIFEEEWPEYRAVVGQLARQGFRRFRLHNLSHFVLLDAVEGATLTAGPGLYTLNSQAALAWQQLGAGAVSLSLEDDQANLAAVLSRDPGVAMIITVYGVVELLSSRIPIRGLRSGELLQGDGGEAVRVETDSGLTVVAATADFSLTGQLATVRAMGCQRWFVDLSRYGLGSARGKAVLAAVRGDEELPGTTLFNFVRGLE